MPTDPVGVDQHVDVFGQGRKLVADAVQARRPGKDQPLAERTRPQASEKVEDLVAIGMAGHRRMVWSSSMHRKGWRPGSL